MAAFIRVLPVAHRYREDKQQHYVLINVNSISYVTNGFINSKEEQSVVAIYFNNGDKPLHVACSMADFQSMVSSDTLIRSLTM